MISDETKRKLRELKIGELIDILKEQELSPEAYADIPFDQRIDMAIDLLYTEKNVSSAEKLKKRAKFRFPAADVNTLYYEGRDLNKNQILELSTCSYIDIPRNVVINGYSGSGKTHLACALGKAACRHLHRTRYMRMSELLEEINLASQGNTGFLRTVNRISNYHVLILDEWLQDIPSERELKYLFEVFERRYDTWPTIFCTQYKISEWHPRLGGSVLADAICDRLIHNSVVVNLGNFNMRKFLASANQTS